MPVTTLKIDGMHCQGCVRNLTTQLSALPGVEKADVQIGEAIVTHRESVSRDNLINVVEDAGFDVIA